MKVNISIECHDVSDLKTHLSVIRQNLLAELKTQGLLLSNKTIELFDGNCYGEHSIKVEFDA